MERFGKSGGTSTANTGASAT